MANRFRDGAHAKAVFYGNGGQVIIEHPPNLIKHGFPVTASGQCPTVEALLSNGDWQLAWDDIPSSHDKKFVVTLKASNFNIKGWLNIADEDVQDTPVLTVFHAGPPR